MISYPIYAEIASTENLTQDFLKCWTNPGLIINYSLQITLLFVGQKVMME